MNVGINEVLHSFFKLQLKNFKKKRFKTETTDRKKRNFRAYIFVNI